MNICGIYDLATSENTFIDCDCSRKSNDLLDLCVVGEDAENVASVITEDFPQIGAAVSDKTDRLFIAVVYDSSDKSLHIFSDMFSSPYFLYYTENNGKFYYSTSLRRLLKMSGIKRSIDSDGVSYFIINGYIFGEKTLVKNVSKLKLGQELIVTENGVRSNKLKFNISPVPKAKARQTLIDAVQNSIRDAAADRDVQCMPLSSGYDSNMVLNTIRQTNPSAIHAFTIGGEKGRNETVAVKDNVSEMDDVDLHIALVGNDHFNILADAVWHLEGSVFERGIILQYVLAKAINAEGGTDVVCGEYSDQIMNKYFGGDLSGTFSDKHKPNQRMLYKYNPYVAGNMIILKKSAVMLNSFGITGHYPFVRKKIIEHTAKLRKENGTGKDLYRKLCADVLPPRVMKNISMVGGSTANEALMSMEYYDELCAAMKSNDTVRDITRMSVARTITPREQLHRVSGVVTRYIDSMKKKPDGENKPFELKAKDMTDGLMKVFLLLFHELFITGKYDDSFECDSAPVCTDDILKIYDLPVARKDR